ncbi:hypothetical protein [Sphingomonas montanisoli]|uniref:Uncharacterized protein n=1 Tax=Sphingomonas montanisoli TaxID=2606412 RepID=A0A5D9CA74_9SPHN|nr:hypothetical protein [Sphingomonas montanisoli]TZG28599.1 hypothetical protein FYJ91_00115 [Sphingomonas montanisoli]
MDTFDRWCLFCDFEFRADHASAPQPILADYIDDLIHLVGRGEAKRVFEHESRVTRIAQARKVNLADGTEALAMVITLGNKRGADPAFLHFDLGGARSPEKEDGEVKGYSAHCLVRLSPDDDRPDRYRMLLEEVRGIGRTPVTRLLNRALRQISKDRGERFLNPDTGRWNNFAAIVEVNPRQSQDLARALEHGAFLPVTLFDTRRVPAFDENPQFSVRQHMLTVKVKPAPGRTFTEALHDLKDVASANGYGHMRVSWRLPGEKRGGSAEMRTDLADLGTAMFAHREMVHIENGLPECCDQISDEFVAAMIDQYA